MHVLSASHPRRAKALHIMMKPKPITRWLVLISALLMIITYFVPVWQILMWAPQYPEGLEMKIWLYTLSGDYKIISGLNHYIGMKHIEVEMFPEFKYMVYVVGVLIAVGLLAVAVNRRLLIVIYPAFLLLAGIAGMVDFYQWGYDYGHNLDPTAPIVVPGMAYQPPLLGTKQLLNFTAYSGPDIGGFVFLVSGVLALGGVAIEFFLKKRSNVAAGIVSTLLVVSLASCTATPEPIVYGKDGCHTCKMIMMDNRFGTEIVTTKGKIYKFDDVNCMQRFIRSGTVTENDIAHILVTDFSNPGSLSDVHSAVFVRSPEIKSPMGSNIAAFASRETIPSEQREWKKLAQDWKNLDSHDENHGAN